MKHLVPSGDGDGEDATTTVLDADLLIPGIGKPIGNATLQFSSNGTIIFAGPRAEAPPFSGPVFDLGRVPVIMPGIWDVHTHFAGTDCDSLSSGMSFHSSTGGYFPEKYDNYACALAQLRETLCAGVTSVRELGGMYGQSLKHVSESALFPSPHFYHASKPIGMTGGHADNQYMPTMITRNDYDAQYEAFGALCDGPDGCVRKVREQLRAQSDLIKIMTSGGVLSAFDSPLDQELSLAEVKAMVDEAHRARRVVAAHAHGIPGIVSAIQGGVTTLEHGSYLNSTLAEEARDAGMLYVPTVTICQTFNRTDKPDEYDDLQWAKGVSVLEHNTAAVKAAIKAGLPMATGTDCPGNCAQAGSEAVWLSTFGLDPLDAIQAATANGPLALGMGLFGTDGMAPLSGQLKAGFVADVIALTASPLLNMTLLTDSSQITHIIKAGVVYKSPSETGICENAQTNDPTLVNTWMPEAPEW